MAGRIALVTGSAGGIGRASALAFAARGAAVIVADVLDAAEETVELIEKNGGTALHARCDVADPNAVRALIDTAVSEYGRLDYAHNNAGVFSPAPLADLDEAEFDRVMRVNLHGVFYCLKYEIKHMRARGDGAIVNTASIWSFVGAGAQAAYAASKHGVMGLTRTAALDHAVDGIRINAVAPGPIQTSMTAAVPGDIMDQIVARTTQGRMGQPAEIADAVVWLCSERASYVNGTVLNVDGGWLAG